MCLIDADALAKAKFHGYQEIEITPSDVNAESYKRGWNDAIDAIIESTPPIERKKGKWIKMSDADGIYYCCSECGEELYREWTFDRYYDLFPRKRSIDKTDFCSHCGADMRGKKK